MLTLNAEYGMRYFNHYSVENVTDQLLLTKSVKHFWTVIVELKFYALFCLFGMAANLFRVAGTSWSFWLLLLLWMLLASFDIDQRYLQLSPVPYMVFFLGGILAEHIHRMAKTLKIPALAWNAATLLCCTIIIICIPPIMRSTLGYHVRWFNYEWPMALLMAGCVLCVAMSSGLMARIFANPLARLLGHISFSLYLLHPAVLHLGHYYIDLPKHLMLPVVIILSLLLAWLSFLLIERPANNLGKYISSKLV
jgi:peptidoglycan/LPS O-acetylase OafA/YrhL